MRRSTRTESHPWLQPRAHTFRILVGWSVLFLFAASMAPAEDIPDVPCVADCNGDGMVTVSELVLLVNIALGDSPPSACADGIPRSGVDIALIIKGVNYAVAGCPVLGPGDCCQCEDFCAAPVDGTCGGCVLVFSGTCRDGSCIRPTPTQTSPPANTPIPTITPGQRDCCQCPDSCAAPVAGSCGSCNVVHNAVCGGGMLCVLDTPTPLPSP